MYPDIVLGQGKKKNTVYYKRFVLKIQLTVHSVEIMIRLALNKKLSFNKN